MATHWFVLVAKQSEANVAGTTPAADTHIVTVTQGSAIDNQLTGNYEGQVTVSGVTGYLRAGPFTSQADAQAYLGTGAQTAPLPGIPGVSVSPGGNLSAADPFAGLAGVATALAKFGAGITDFFKAMEDGKMWRSLGWVGLGAAFTVIGLLVWLRKPITRAVGTAVKAVAL